MSNDKINQEYLDKIKLFQKYNKHYYDLNNPLVNDQEFDNLPSWCDFKFDLSAAPFNLDYPLALDDAHTGPRGHKELAKAIKELL